MAASTHTLTSSVLTNIGKGSQRINCEVITTDWVASSTDATVLTLDVVLKGYLLKVVTNPGSTAPTDNYGIALKDPEDANLDAAGSLLLNRHTTTTQQLYPTVTGAATPLFLCGTYGLAITNNSVNSASGRVVLYLVDSL